MRLSLVIFLGLISLSGHSQIQFENGYIITNEGERINCLIRNLDWKNNPKAIEYVLAEGEEVKQATIERITEFGIVDGNTFRRFVVKMDRSSDFLTSLSTERNPSFAEETLFLKVLIQGKATLFQYEEDGLLRFFYSVDQQPVSQLVFKRYHTPDDQVVRNEMYKQQLVNELSCGQLNEDALKVKYSPSDLERYFSAFNACHGSDSNRLNKVMKPDLFNLNIRPGLAYNSMTLTGYAVIVDADFGKQPTYRLGVELVCHAIQQK